MNRLQGRWKDPFALLKASRTLLEASLAMYLITIPFGAAVVQLRTVLMIFLMFLLVVRRVLLGVSRNTPTEGVATAYLPFRGLLPLFALAGSALLSSIQSINPALSLHAQYYTPIAVLVFFASQDVTVDARALKRWSLVATSIVALLAVDSIAQYLSGKSLFGGASLYGNRVTASLPHPNDLAIIPILLPLCLLCFAVSKHRLEQLCIMVCVAASFFAVLLSQSRNAWLGILAGLVAFGSLNRRLRTLTVVMIVALAAMAMATYVADIASFRDRVASFVQLRQEGRVGIWLTAWHMFLDSPLLGQGPGTFGQLYPSYLDTISLPSGYSPEEAYIPWAHNIYLEFLAERGIIGLMALAFFLSTILLHLVRAWRIEQLRPFTASIASAFVVFLAMGLLDLTFMKDWVILLFFFLAGTALRLPDLTARTKPQARGEGKCEKDGT